MAPNGGCVCICIYLQEVNEAFPLGSPIGGRGRICGTGIGASPCGGRTPERAAARIYRPLGASAFSISFLYIILLYPFRYIYIVLSILSITARRKAAAIPNVRDKPARGLHRRPPPVPRRRYSLTPPVRPNTRRRQRAKKAGG